MLTIPADLLPRDGRFGSGPAKVRPSALAAVTSSGLMGTSHRQAPVKDLVARVQARLAELYSMPEGYQVVLGNGGSTLFWDVAVASLIDQRASFGVFGEFGAKFAAAAQAAPFVDRVDVNSADPGQLALPSVSADLDTVAWAHNETSTGVCAPVRRPAGAADALVLLDATSSAGGMAINLAETDVVYFAPQKNFSSDGGLWVAFCSPAALERAQRITGSGRWVPESLNLSVAASNSVAHQTLNTPAIATLVMLDEQLGWMLESGGIDFVTARTAASSSQLYTWADGHEVAQAFVTDPALRSPVVATIDFDASVDAAALAATLRANGVVDVEPYRKLGRNQIRVGCYASVDPADVTALIACIDWVLQHSGK